MRDISHLFQKDGKAIVFKLPNELNDIIKEQYEKRILVYYLIFNIFYSYLKLKEE